MPAPLHAAVAEHIHLHGQLAWPSGYASQVAAARCGSIESVCLWQLRTSCDVDFGGYQRVVAHRVGAWLHRVADPAFVLRQVHHELRSLLRDRELHMTVLVRQGDQVRYAAVGMAPPAVMVDTICRCAISGPAMPGLRGGQAPDPACGELTITEPSVLLVDPSGLMASRIEWLPDACCSACAVAAA